MSNILRDGWELAVAMRCVETAVGKPNMMRMIEAMRTSRKERKYNLKEARSHWAWKIVTKWWGK